MTIMKRINLLITILLQLFPVGILQQQARGSCSKTALYGICHIKANPNLPSNITGVVYLHEKFTHICKTDFLNIQVKIENVPTDDGTLLHGFHIHKYGDMTNGCEGMGPHYNPFNATHGKLWNSMYTRHVGDLGNIRQRRKDGVINTRIVDYLATLDGEYSIYGRGLVLHAKQDDLGQGTNKGSRRTGNAGKRLACCTIIRSPPHSLDQYTMY